MLFNAYAGDLWKRLTIYLRREVAATVGLSRSALSKVAKVSFFKVAEYQARGVIHFRSVIRMRFGTQVDTQAIADVGGGITSRNVARYIAKYVTKGGEITGLPPRGIKSLGTLDHLHLPAHTERMVRACFVLDDVNAGTLR
ncbi:hypothetical protein Aau02nite_04700 [Amorphoplanes auranticolor]|uniref:Uncharacterized protein n=1 Tax=Actinoplanes auranticolor TaxID=47988 RepID=A0A919VIA3_9ACTN|nr:replication initiator [Actinoplanes auranticolor]GIM63544.1 hypothetical protein Aau02nite_04700 [Actinoplanes auranticolor]